MYKVKEVIDKTNKNDKHYRIKLTNGDSINIVFDYDDNEDEWLYNPNRFTTLSLCELEELLKISKELNKNKDWKK